MDPNTPPAGRARAGASSAGALLLVAAALACAAADPPAPAQPPQASAAPAAGARPRIALVLSGGGARGVAHIGVLKVLEQLRIPVDYVVGTSMGSIVGGSYAAGLSPRQLESRVLQADWDRILSSLPPRQDRSTRSKQLERANVFGIEVGVRDGRLVLPEGAIVGHNLEVFLADTLGQRADVGSFDQLSIPYRAVATDIETGKMVVLSQGSLVKAMRASMSVPGVFSPAEVDGRMLVDGGLVRNLPVDVARAMGAEVVIAVNLGSPLLKRDQIDSVIGVAEQMINILTEQNVQQSLGELTPADVLISPALGDYSAADFRDTARTIPIGEAAARAVADRLRAFSLPPEQYEVLRAEQLSRVKVPRPIEGVKVETARLRFVNPKAVSAEVESTRAKAPQADSVEADVSSLMASGDFEQVRYKFAEVDGKRVLVLEPIEKGWGPNYLRFGLDLSTDFTGNSAFDIRVDHRMTWLNRLGLEWRNDVSLGELTGIRTELYQPLNHARTFFVAPYAQWYTRNENVYFNDEAVAQYGVTKGVLGLDFGYDIQRYGEVRLGYQGGIVNQDREIGIVLPSADLDVGALLLRGVVDRLDNWAFPSTGYFTRLAYTYSREGLGASEDYDLLEFQLQKPITFNPRNRLLVNLRYATSFGSTLPYYDLIGAGGFLNLSGYQPRQFLINDDLVYGSLVYYYRLGNPGAFTDILYLGASAELADIGSRVNGTQPGGLTWGSSLFLGADTAVGPVFLGVGFADESYALYLFLGKP
jgi:NTE family protein